MENTRTLKDSEVPELAKTSVESMTAEMVDGIVGDFLKQLQLKGSTIDQDGIDNLKKIVKNHAKITLKIALKVDMDLVNDLQITVRDLKQSMLGE